MAASDLVEDSIDRDRIVDDHLVSDDYFCPVCYCLLWKPRSCASCKNLFCEKCIHAWLAGSTGNPRCPYRCKSYKYEQCPPHIYASLTRINVRCRNSALGCTQILPYDQLEQHETIECQYLSRRCSECDKLIFQIEFDEHRQYPGLCLPCPIRCTICQVYVEKPRFRKHFDDCYKEKMNKLWEEAIQRRFEQELLHDQRREYIDNWVFVGNLIRTTNLFEQQRQMSRLPTNLLGVDSIYVSELF
ncbi:unnamed protein product [Rotaria sp. Silwood2]|nr:unnamed protein product [Rotaria sp. Silwood2]